MLGFDLDGFDVAGGLLDFVVFHVLEGVGRVDDHVRGAPDPRGGGGGVVTVTVTSG